jgi:glycosyltransferase involved in cell wall biosynthesis
LDTPHLSIIIPAYNEERRLPNTLEQAFSFIQDQPYEVEVLIVENGSDDCTLEIAQKFSAEHIHFHAIHEPGRGKGLAVRRGMLEAHGQYRFMCDADLSMPLSEINRFLPPELEEFDIAIGSREAQEAVRYDEPAYRHFGGRAINFMIRALILPGLHDTQCGFKCFRSEIAEDLFQNQTMTGWSFDIELLFIARRRGYRVVEIPIPWYFNPESKLNVIQDAFQMGVDIIKMRWNAWNGVYDQKGV